MGYGTVKTLSTIVVYVKFMDKIQERALEKFAFHSIIISYLSRNSVAFDVLSFLFRDCRVSGRCRVNHKKPQDIPHYPHQPCTTQRRRRRNYKPAKNDSNEYFFSVIARLICRTLRKMTVTNIFSQCSQTNCYLDIL